MVTAQYMFHLIELLKLLKIQQHLKLRPLPYLLKKNRSPFLIRKILRKKMIRIDNKKGQNYEQYKASISYLHYSLPDMLYNILYFSSTPKNDAPPPSCTPTTSSPGFTNN